MCSCFGEIFPLSWPLISSVAYRGSDTFSDTFDAHFPCPKCNKYQETSNWNFWFYVYDNSHYRTIDAPIPDLS